MHPLIDALVILGLLAIGLIAAGHSAELFSAAPVSAAIVLPSLAWYATVTPLLVRSDVETRRLPNAATLPGVVVVALTAAGAAFAGPGAPDPGASVITLVAVATGGTVLARRGGLGMGDVKLASGLAASVALVAPDALLPFGVLTGLAGLAAAAVARRRPDACRPDACRPGACGPDACGPDVCRPDACRPVTIAFGPALLVGYWGALAFVAASSPAGVPP